MPSTSHSFSERESVFPADLSRLPEIREFVEAAAADFGFGADDRYSIKLALSEAVANAVEHGSSSSDDTIRVRALKEGDALSLYVADGGTFVPRVSHGSGLAERGRGFEFMGELMDEVDLRPGRDGTVVRLTKRLED